MEEPISIRGVAIKTLMRQIEAQQIHPLGGRMSMEYIRRYYGVPAKRGLPVTYTGGVEPQRGVITGSDGAHLRIRLDGEKATDIFHPTWELTYKEEA